MQLDAIGIVVSDVPRALRFYRLLGLPFPAEVGEGEDHVEATLPSGVRVMLDGEAMIKGFVEDWVEPRGQRVGLAIRCDSPAEVDAVHQRVVDAGFRSAKAPHDAFWGQRYAQVYDPDGSRVDLYAAL